MAGRRGFSPRRGSGSGIARGWELGPGGITQQTITTGSVTAIGAGLTTLGGQLTVMRTRGLLYVYLSAASNDGDGFHGAFGIIKVSDQAFAAGVASIPSPVNEAENNGWFVHQYISVHEGFGGANGASTQRIDVDSKAMRKFDSEETIVAILEVALVGTATMLVTFDSRMLIQDSSR